MYVRKNKLCEKIVFIDGMWGTGKAILAPVIGSFEGVEKQVLNHNFEYICAILNNENKIKGNSQALLQLIADVALFNSMISREVNFRPADITGVFKNPFTMRYFKRLLKPGDDAITDEITTKKPFLQIMSHNILPISNLLFHTFGTGVRLVDMVRHPVYMAEHWFNYIERVGIDKREFTLGVGEEGEIPWFAKDINNYLSLNTMDKVIYSMQSLTKMQEEILKSHNKKIMDNIILIPFESFVLDPIPWVKDLAILLDTKTTNITIKTLKNEKCPRDSIHAGKGMKGYGWQKDTLKLSEESDFFRRLEFIKNNTSNETFSIMETLSSQYQKKYNFPRKMPWDT